MKYIIILGDGMADSPIAELGNKTPLMAASTPNIDELCRKGRCGRLITVPDDMPPGSEVANMAVLGYDVKKVYQGRGVLEAASMGIELEETDIALRCNLISIDDEKIKNHSSGHISNEEAHKLIKTLQDELETEKIKIYPGVSYRHLLVIKGEKNNVECTPPHDVPGISMKEVMVKTSNGIPKLEHILNDLIIKSRKILNDHPVNLKRISEGKDPANSIWPWSPGTKPKMKTLQELYGVSGAMISAVDLLYGIGKYAGMKAIKVEGSTGLYDTNYEGKAKAAVEALKEVDLVYLHIEASDEAGHEGDYKLKKKTIEYLDSRVVKYIIEETANMKEPVSIALIPDHPTPCNIKTHTREAVPFVIFNPKKLADSIFEYNEESVKDGFYRTLKGDEFMLSLLNK